MIELRVISLTEDGKPPLYEEATRTARQNDADKLPKYSDITMLNRDNINSISSNSDISERIRNIPNQRTHRTFVENSSNQTVSSAKFKFTLVCLPISLVIFAVLSIAMISTGSIFINVCKLHPNMPTWLIVNGIIYLLISIIGLPSVMYYNFKRNNTLDCVSCPLNYLTQFIIGFLVFGFILGNIWIKTYYMNRETFIDCNFLKNISFWLVNFCWIFIALVCLFACVFFRCKMI